MNQFAVSVISNATPLIYLGKLGRLGLLFDLYDSVSIPFDVYEEVVTNGKRLVAPEAQIVEQLVQKGLIRVHDINFPQPLPEWSAPLDRGEIGVILLAQNIPVHYVLIDNLHARRAARQANCKVKGKVGLLLDALRQKYLNFLEFELLINQISADPSFWISEQLCAEALRLARTES